MTYQPPDPRTEYEQAAQDFAAWREVGTRTRHVSPECAALVEADPAAFVRLIRKYARARCKPL